MPLNVKQFMDGVSELTDHHNIRVAIKQSGKGAALCGATCFVGGILLGPVGLAAGGAVGGLVAAYMTRGTFRSVGDIIRNDLTDSQRERLYYHITESIREVDGSDLVTLLPLVLSATNVQQAVLQSVISFMVKEMQLRIID